MKKKLIIMMSLALIFVMPCSAIENIKHTEKNNNIEKTFEAGLRPYWEKYNDPILDGYIQEGLEQNLNIKMADSRIKESEAILGTINAQRLPQLSINPSVYPYRMISKWSGNFGSGTMLYLPLLLNWELDLFGKISNRVDASKMFVNMKKEDLSIIQLSISSEIAASYFNIILRDKLIENNNELVKNLEESLKLTRQLYSSGIIPYDKLYTAEYELATEKTKLNNLLRERENLLHQFAVLRGVSPDNSIKISRGKIETLNYPFDVNTSISSDLIFNRPDVKKAEFEIKKVKLDVKATKKAFLPSLNLNEMIGLQNIESSRIFNWDSNVYQLGGGLLMDLYSGGYKWSMLKYNKELAIEKLHQYNNVLLNAVCEVENSISSFKADYNTYNEFKNMIDNSHHYYNVANIRYTNGTGNKLDELSARRQVIKNENSMYLAKVSTLIDTVNIYKSLGGSLE